MSLELGNSAYERGEYDKAAYYWNDIAQNGDPKAQYNLGLLWEQGLGSTPRNIDEAANWYFKSAQQEFVPAMVRLAKIQLYVGNDVAAKSWLNRAARWGNADAIKALSNAGEYVPNADLLSNSEAVKAKQKAAMNAQAVEAWGGVANILGCSMAGGTGCTTSGPQPRSYNLTNSQDLLQKSVATPKQFSAERTDIGCVTDAGCGVGYICAKPVGENGKCIRLVDDSGAPTMGYPSSAVQNSRHYRTCSTTADCSAGFTCDEGYKLCIRY